MPDFIQGSQLRRLLLGNQVIKTAQAFPQGAPGTATLFTVAGGSVLVTSLFGVVSTVVAGTDPQLSLGTIPTVGTASTTGIATSVALTSREVGTWVGVLATSGKAGVLVAGTNASTTLFAQTPFVVPAGTITQTAQVAETGAISWYLTYVPLDTGASVS